MTHSSPTLISDFLKSVETFPNRPAKPVATCGFPLAGGVRYKEFLKKLKPYKP